MLMEYFEVKRLQMIHAYLNQMENIFLTRLGLSPATELYGEDVELHSVHGRFEVCIAPNYRYYFQIVSKILSFKAR